MLPLSDVILRLVALAFLIVVLGLTASLVKDHNNSQVAFALFTACFAMLTALIYGAFACIFQILAEPITMVVLTALNFIFTLCATAAVAAGLGVHSCGNSEWLASNSLTTGSESRCRKLQATVVFLVLSCALFLAMLILWLVYLIQNGLSKRRSKRSSKA